MQAREQHRFKLASIYLIVCLTINKTINPSLYNTKIYKTE